MKRIIFYILLAIFILPLTSSAQGEPGLLDPVPDSYKLLAPSTDEKEEDYHYNDFEGFIVHGYLRALSIMSTLD